jgi:predicted kinase
MGPALQNFEQLVRLTHSEDERTALDGLQQWTAEQHARLEQLFEERHRDGFVRECHGDLHLGNMALIDGRIRIFDCIEFNPELRWIDVMNEVAFLAMDLIQHQRSDLAYRFLDGYLQITGDYRGLLLLRYYMVYRALVRAKVAAMRAEQPSLDPHAQRSLHDKRRTHVMLARRLAESVHPGLAILHGLSGSGKSVVSQIVLETIGAIRIRSDVERKRLHGLSAAARSQSAVGEGLYSAKAGDATYDHLTELAAHALDAGFPVLVDAAFLKREQRERMRKLAQLKHVPFAILHTDATETTLRRRIAHREADGADASEASGTVLDWQLATQEPLTEGERAMTSSFDTEREDSHAVVERARQIFQALDAAQHTGLSRADKG